MRNTPVELFAWIGEQISDGETGLITVIDHNGFPLPLFAMDRALVDRMEPIVRRSISHKNARLVRLVQKETLRTVTTESEKMN